jgi:hypothetical protein
MRLDRERLIKLLNMTGSEHDAEALSAIRRSNALLRRHRTTWEELLAPSQEPLQAPQRNHTQAWQQRPKPGLRDSHAFRERPNWQPNVRYSRRQRYWTTSEARQALVSDMLGVVFFPVTVFAWLYERVVPGKRRWLKPLALLVPICGGAMAAMIWVVMLLSVAQLIGIV